VRVLFTGSSSFTGYWFIRELHAAGHEVIATFRGPGASAYSEDPRATRVARLGELCEPRFNCSFGGDRFIELIRELGQIDVLCHHAADTTNYKSADFDVLSAVESNTHRIGEVFSALKASGCNRMVLTGSFFAGGEGAGSEGLPHFSAYGLSKAITSEIVRFQALQADFGFSKFVIPNPFGPFEEARFTTYLVRTWYQRETPSVSSPAYVRDNIHVSLLAKAYLRFLERVSGGERCERTNPSGYVESQGMFALRFSREMQSRLGLDCPLDLKVQTEFVEPRVRLNTEPLDAGELEWSETEAWDELARYYEGLFGK
jgi:nucleoside-diphosphate-sugar epimerase